MVCRRFLVPQLVRHRIFPPLRFHIGLEDMEGTISLSPAAGSLRLPLGLHRRAADNKNDDDDQTDISEAPSTPGRGQIMSYLTKMATAANTTGRPRDVDRMRD